MAAHAFSLPPEEETSENTGSQMGRWKEEGWEGQEEGVRERGDGERMRLGLVLCRCCCFGVHFFLCSLLSPPYLSSLWPAPLPSRSHVML